MTVEYLDLADHVTIAEQVTGLDVDTLLRVAQLGVAESARHAPAAGCGETELYPDFVDKGAVLAVRLAKNHPLPDGNKRVAWVALRLFVEINDWRWERAPHVDDAEEAALAIAHPERGAFFRRIVFLFNDQAVVTSWVSPFSPSSSIGTSLAGPVTV